MNKVTNTGRMLVLVELEKVQFLLGKFQNIPSFINLWEKDN